MRLRACLGIAVLAALAGCETVPESVKIDVDGRTLEFKKKPLPEPEPETEPESEREPEPTEPEAAEPQATEPQDARGR